MVKGHERPLTVDGSLSQEELLVYLLESKFFIH